MSQRPRRRARKRQGGFTLIEVTIAMMVFAITITAITAMNSTSIQAANASLVTQEGGAILDQFLEMLTVDALRWQTNSRANLKYLGGNTSYQISTTTVTNWNKYTERPVNYQMRYKYNPTDPVADPGRGARYCLYFSYRWAGTDANVNDFRDELLELNVVALTPRSPNGLAASAPGCANTRSNFNNSCSTDLMDDTKCSLAARRQQFIRISRAAMIRRNRSGF